MPWLSIGCFQESMLIPTTHLSCNTFKQQQGVGCIWICLCIGWEIGISFYYSAYEYLFSSEALLKKLSFSNMCVWNPCQKQMTLSVCICGVLCFIPSIYLTMLCQKCYFNYGFVVWFEIKYCDSNSIGLSAQGHLHYCGSFWFLMDFKTGI